MIVTAYKQNSSLFIPTEYIQELFNTDFTQIKLEISVLEFKNDTVKMTSGIIKKNKIDGVKFQNEIRKEWNRDI